MSRLGSIKRRGSSGDALEIAPLIDIIFILLIFFMVSTTFVRSFEVGIERPSASSAQPADVRAIRVTLAKSGAVFIDGQPVQAWMVQSRVRELLAQDPKRPVLVTADQDLRTGKLVQIVDHCRMAGARNVAVDVERGER